MPIAPRSFLYAHDAASGVATITLNRPERLNALTFEVYAELRDIFGALDLEPGVRAIVLTGAGRGFCSGGDVEDIIGALLSRDAKSLRDFTRMTCDVILNIRRCRRPVIAALNGTAAGAGAVIAAACDFRVAAETAKIAFLFVRVGLSGADMGASWLLPRLVGHGRATEILMTGEFVEPQRALEIGLYHRVVPAVQVLTEARRLAETLARGPAAALAVSKRALDHEWSLGFEQALAHEAEIQAGLMEHSDFREAYQASREKREPRFQ
ncbi:MAG: enoyl-CoA hydratase family protein [Candidatus Eisenbacteria bacterium]|uniref:Enoyl-CoA hydratase family protein n=1 Tax=Eiseniibacteriota bacterium TaxID=2212470 RepID=A0A538TK18_UNCEI|nr:MAG: enoyl-CoA hydratase family protein [Candidatus Eisenbacteria bacterium]